MTIVMWWANPSALPLASVNIVRKQGQHVDCCHILAPTSPWTFQDAWLYMKWKLLNKAVGWYISKTWVKRKAKSQGGGEREGRGGGRYETTTDENKKTMIWGRGGGRSEGCETKTNAKWGGGGGGGGRDEAENENPNRGENNMGGHRPAARQIALLSNPAPPATPTEWAIFARPPSPVLPPHNPRPPRWTTHHANPKIIIITHLTCCNCCHWQWFGPNDRSFGPNDAIAQMVPLRKTWRQSQHWIAWSAATRRAWRVWTSMGWQHRVKRHHGDQGRVVSWMCEFLEFFALCLWSLLFELYDQFLQGSSFGHT